MKPFIMLDKRRESTTGENDGKFHVKIKASIAVGPKGLKEWKPRRAKTGVYLSVGEFKSMVGKRPPKSLESQLETVNAKLRKAELICKMPGITPDRYLELMDSSGSFEDVIGMFDYYIGECLKENPETGEARDGNALALRNAKHFFIRYKGSNYIAYAEITKDWLESCKAWALKDEFKDKKLVRAAITPVSFYIYCRALRTIMNLANDPFGIITKEEIPFGSGRSKFKIPSSNKKKRKVKLELPLEKLVEQKNKILSYSCNFPKVNKSLNYWKASFFGNGANMADVLRWKIGEYDKEKKQIWFERKKTELTEEDNEPILIVVGPELQEIITIEGNKSLDPDEYIFPVLNKRMNSAERKQEVLDFIDFMNKRLKKAARDMKLEIKLSSGSARYLLSTLLDRSGIPRSVIKELLGHGSEDMQSHYVSPYVLELRKQINGILSIAK